jgi:hypothetical protein
MDRWMDTHRTYTIKNMYFWNKVLHVKKHTHFHDPCPTRIRQDKAFIWRFLKLGVPPNHPVIRPFYYWTPWYLGDLHASLPVARCLQVLVDSLQRDFQQQLRSASWTAGGWVESDVFPNLCVCVWKWGTPHKCVLIWKMLFFCIGFQSCPLAMFSQSYFEADGRDMSGWSMLLVVTRQVHVLSPVQVPVRQVGSAGGWVYAAPLPPMAILGRSGSNSKTPLPDARILLEFHYFK